MASEGSRRLEEALTMMAEAIKLKLAEMDPSPGVASPSSEGTGTSGEDSADEARSAAAVELTQSQRERNFMKNMYPRCGIYVGHYEEKVISLVARLFGRQDVPMDVPYLPENEKEKTAYGELGGGTALHWAVRMEDLAAVTRILAEGKVDVNAKDEVWHATALHWVARIGNMAIVTAMLTDHLASGRFSLIVKDKWQCTAIVYAILKSNVPMVRELLRIWNPAHIGEGGVIEEVNDAMCRDASIKEMQQFFDSQRETWYAKLYSGKGTSLHWAVLMEDTAMASHSLAQDKAIVNAKNKFGYSPLHMAVLSGDLDMVKIMVAQHLKSGNFDVNAQMKGGYTALHYAILCGRRENSDMVRDLLKCKETMRLIEECRIGETPLQIAHERGFKDIQKALLEHEGVQRFVDELYRDRQVFVDAANAILVGAALIASVTFAAWLQPPLGYASEWVDVQHNQGMRAFWIFNCLSFYFAIRTVVFGAQSVLPRNPYFIKVTVEKLRKNLLMTACLLACSVFFVIIAFGIAGCIVLSPIFKFRLYMVIPTIIGGLVCVISLVFLSKSMWQDSALGKNLALGKVEEWKMRATVESFHVEYLYERLVK